jgi:hypothetical protein
MNGNNNLPAHQRPAAQAGGSILALGFEQFKQFAGEIARSGMIPGVKDASQAMTLMLVCDAQGRHIGEAITRFHVIKNNVTVKSRNQLADFQRRGGRVRWIETTAQACRAVFSHPVFHPEPLEIAITLEELMENGTAMSWDEDHRRLVVKDIYKRNGAAMLRARVTTAGVTAVDPGALEGARTYEEVLDVGAAQPEDLEPTAADPRDDQAEASAEPRAALGGRTAPAPVSDPAAAEELAAEDLIGAGDSDSADVRLYRQVVEDAIAQVNRAIKRRLEAGPGSEGLRQYLLQPVAVHSWLYDQATGAGLLDREPTIDPKTAHALPVPLAALVRALDGLYRRERSWVRRQLAEFFSRHSERIAAAGGA